MPDFRIDESAIEHRKLRAVGLTAFGLWAAGGTYAMRELTDGWVPKYWVQTWPAGARHATALVRVGLWVPETRDGIDGYRFHDWHDYQRAASKVTQDRTRARERMRTLRQTATGHTGREGRADTPDRPPPRSREQTAHKHRTNHERSAEVRPKFDTCSPTPYPLPLAGHFEGESSGKPTRAEQNPRSQALSSENRPPDRCTRHASIDDPPPCQACAKARRQAEHFDDTQSRQSRYAESRQARQRAEQRAAAIAACPMCNESGYLDSATICRHDPDAADRARRGSAKVRAALRAVRGGEPTEKDTDGE